MGEINGLLKEKSYEKIYTVLANKIPLIFNYNSKRMFNTSVKVTVLDPLFITRFVYAESSFTIFIRKLSKYKVGSYIEASFSIVLHRKMDPYWN